MARSVALILCIAVAGCAAEDLELLPFTASDAGDARFDAGETDAGLADTGPADVGVLDAGGGFGLCLGGAVDCSSCPQEPCDLGAGCPGRCAVACDVNANCMLSLSDGAQGPPVCGDGTDCGLPGESLTYCRGLSERCLVTADSGLSRVSRGRMPVHVQRTVHRALSRRQLPARMSGWRDVCFVTARWDRSNVGPPHPRALRPARARPGCLGEPTDRNP